METSSIVLTCINVSYAKKIGSLVSTDANFKYHTDNKCYKNYVHKKALERIKVSFFADF